MALRIWIERDVFVFVEKARVMHLPGDGAGLACGGIFEIEDIDGLTLPSGCSTDIRRGSPAAASAVIATRLHAWGS